MPADDDELRQRFWDAFWDGVASAFTFGVSALDWLPRQRAMTPTPDPGPDDGFARDQQALAGDWNLILGDLGRVTADLEAARRKVARADAREVRRRSRRRARRNRRR